VTIFAWRSLFKITRKTLPLIDGEGDVWDGKKWIVILLFVSERMAGIGLVLCDPHPGILFRIFGIGFMFFAVLILLAIRANDFRVLVSHLVKKRRECMAALAAQRVDGLFMIRYLTRVLHKPPIAPFAY
jgi:hypothetical protein